MAGIWTQPPPLQPIAKKMVLLTLVSYEHLLHGILAHMKGTPVRS